MILALKTENDIFWTLQAKPKQSALSCKDDHKHEESDNWNEPETVIAAFLFWCGLDRNWNLLPKPAVIPKAADEV